MATQLVLVQPFKVQVLVGLPLHQSERSFAIQSDILLLGGMSLAYEVVLWDWNGTLLDDAGFGSSIINNMMRKRGLPEKSREEHASVFDFPVIGYYERIGFDFTKEPFEELSHEFIDAYYRDVKNCELQAGARKVLDNMKQAGCRQLILSASRQDHLEDQVRFYELSGFFEELLGIDSVHAPGKTGRGCEWIESSNVSRKNVLLIGDTVHDAQVAGKMGIDCWLVGSGHNSESRLRETGFPFFNSLAEIESSLMSNSTERAGA